LPEKTSNWQKLKRLRRSQWFVILQAPFVLLLTWYRLRLRGYQQTLAEITRPPVSGMLPEDQLLLAKDVAHALAVANRLGPWKPRCLVRSLALGWLLARRDISFEIRIGIPREKTALHDSGTVGLNAHAWVEHAGVVLNDRQDVATTFSAFDTGPGSA
jgi:hypothetical protein